MKPLWSITGFYISKVSHLITAYYHHIIAYYHYIQRIVIYNSCFTFTFYAAYVMCIYLDHLFLCTRFDLLKMLAVLCHKINTKSLDKMLNFMISKIKLNIFHREYDNILLHNQPNYKLANTSTQPPLLIVSSTNRKCYSRTGTCSQGWRGLYHNFRGL